MLKVRDAMLVRPMRSAITDGKFLALAFLGAVLIVFAVHFLDFKGSVLNFEKVSAGGTLLDVKPSFTEEEAVQRLAAYGEEGRKLYAFRNLTVDILLPISVLPFLFLFMRRALQGVSIGPVGRALLVSLPFVYVLFDLAENGAVLALLEAYPSRIHILYAILPYLTVVKRMASMLALVIPLLIFSFLLVRRMAKA
jgi:hypothetical protein